MRRNDNFTVPYTLGEVTPNGTFTIEFGQALMIPADSNVTKISQSDIFLQLQKADS